MNDDTNGATPKRKPGRKGGRDRNQQRLANEWRPAFLANLQNTGNVRAACQAAGIDRKTAYRARASSKVFKNKWDEALEDACDLLEATARQRAMASSDSLIKFLLQAHRPDRYRDTRRLEHTGADGGPIEILSIGEIWGEDDDDTTSVIGEDEAETSS